MIDFRNFRLGRLPHDPTRVAAVKPHVMATTAPAPKDLPRSDLVWTPTLADNDALPTCTVAGLMNSARMWALLHGFDLVNVEDKLLAFYAAVAGCAPTKAAIAATDGLVMLDVLEHAQRIGFDIGAQAPIVPDLAMIHMPNMGALKDAIFTKGSAYVGITLYEPDMQPGASYTGAPSGSVVGGHCLDPWSFTAGGFGVATWGRTIHANAEWLMSRIDEAYAVTWTFAA